MPQKQEIERRFLVIDNRWRIGSRAGHSCEQGYISSNVEKITVRVRLIGSRGFLTFKGPTHGISRREMEYEIPANEAEYMLKKFCDDRRISKTRYNLKFNGLLWEIDEFSGANKGLILAEIELEREDQPFEKPDWIGKEISMDSRYFNAMLAQHPFSEWEREEKDF